MSGFSYKINIEMSSFSCKIDIEMSGFSCKIALHQKKPHRTGKSGTVRRIIRKSEQTYFGLR